MASPDVPEVTEIEPGLRAIHIEAGPLQAHSPEELYPYVDEFAEGIRAYAAAEGLSYDVVHSHYWVAGLAGAALKKRWGVPHVTMFHTLGEVKNRSSLSESESPLRISAEAVVVADADRVICATEHEKSLLAHLYDADPQRIEVVPLGVDVERFKPLDKEDARRQLGFEDARIILFVGRIEPLKGVDILINAAAMLESDVECSVLIVGGDESSKAQIAQLQGLASDLGIEHRVAFVGAVDHDKLPLFYNAADVCVVPSHYESFGLVAVEAMACGVPVVASRVGGLTGTVKDGETGYLIPWLCPEPFAERIEMLLDNESLRRNLGEAAREAVGRYRWESVAARVMGVYASLNGTVGQPVASGA
jgi:D-inositol-3-phosphate glycosyltransferase